MKISIQGNLMFNLHENYTLTRTSYANKCASMMGWLTLCLVLFCLSLPIQAQEQCTENEKVVCYYGSWAKNRLDAGYFNVSNIDASLCTHLVYSFAGLDIDLKITSLDYELDIRDENYANLIKLKEDNPCLKVLLAVGGWNEGSIKYSVMASTDESRRDFAESALRFLVHYGFDGLDLDWEYPTKRGGIEEDLDNFKQLLQVLYDRLSKWKLLLTIAIPMALDDFDKAYGIEALQIPDYVSIMGYDYTPTDSATTGLLSPLPVIESNIEALISKGLNPNKIILGVPAYARTFTLADADEHDLQAPTSGPGAQGKFTRERGFLSYYELQLKLQNKRYTKVCLDVEANCYTYYKLDWISYDSIETYQSKINMAKRKQLGGVMVWTIDTDDFSGQFGEPYTVLNAIREAYQETRA